MRPALFLGLWFPLLAGAAPRIAIIIDDLGNAKGLGEQVLALPAAVTCAVLPHTPYASYLARRAAALGHEVMVHVPMQAVEPGPLGPGALRLEQDEVEFKTQLRRDLASVPQARGVNNHMGSLLTRHPGAMAWLMDILAPGGYYFIDSRTTLFTVAEQVARERGVPSARRRVFLDPAPGEGEARRQYQRLLRIARRRGSAIAIGHPHPATLRLLRRELPRLAAQGVELVPASRLTHRPRRYSWPASSSPSPKVAKNSKPSPSSTCCAAPK